MGRSIVTGKRSARKAQCSTQQVIRNRRTGHGLVVTALGFTLLELMIVISIIIILAAVALPQYHKTIMHARETVLKDDLFKMRSLIDQYSADKGKLPQSLDDLVTAGYMRQKPKDPITDADDWNPQMGDDPYTGDQGMVDVHSSSSEVSTEGTPYSDW